MANAQVRRRGALRIRRRDLAGLLAAGIALAFVLIAIAAPLVVPADPLEIDLILRLKAPSWIEGGLPGSLLGTDQLGRDVLSRVIYGARVSLAVSAAAVVVAVAIGLPLGILSGFFGGVFDTVIHRLIEIQLALPFVLVAIVLTVLFQPGTLSLILVLGISGWVTYGRLGRVETKTIKEHEFVTGARAIGCTDARIISRHILPNLLPTLIVIGSIQLAQFILAEAALSFLGLGILPPTPSWGGMVNEGREYIWIAWWIQTFPGIAMVICVSAVGMMGNWLRDRLDPKLRL